MRYLLDDDEFEKSLNYYDGILVPYVCYCYNYDQNRKNNRVLQRNDEIRCIRWIYDYNDYVHGDHCKVFAKLGEHFASIFVIFSKNYLFCVTGYAINIHSFFTVFVTWEQFMIYTVPMYPLLYN